MLQIYGISRIVTSRAGYHAGLTCLMTGLFCFLSSIALQATCITPNTLRIVASGPDSLGIQWNDFSSQPSGYQVQVLKTSRGNETIGIFTSTVKSFVMRDLQSGTHYEFRVRTVCGTDTSAWSARITGLTHLLNDGFCGRDLALQNDNCRLGRNQVFPIEVNGISGSALGQDVDFLELRLIIRHTFPADLVLRLTSPSGVSVLLSRNNGVGTDHYGNPDAAECTETAIFSPLACIPVNSAFGSLSGPFLPQEPFTLFHDGSDPNGTWKLEICDDHPDDLGTLEYVGLHFSSNACAPPLEVFITEVADTSVLLKLRPLPTCDSVWVELVPAGGTPGSGRQPGGPGHILRRFGCGQQTYLVDGLVAGQSYAVYARTQCTQSQFSFNSCELPFSTLCNAPGLRTDADRLDLCQGNCYDACPIDSIWYSMPLDGPAWSVGTGATPSSGTGPSSDIWGVGNYLYVEASDPGCQQNATALLESSCVIWETLPLSCHFSFHYHLWGPDIVGLFLDLSADGGMTWSPVWHVLGNQGNQWTRADLDLPVQEQVTYKFRFRGVLSGPLADIALDDLVFMGSVSAGLEQHTYYADEDGDLYGNPDRPLVTCLPQPPPGYVDNDGDCDDSNPFIHPAAEEIPCNGIDDDCNGLIDDVAGSLELQQVSVTDASCLGVEDGGISLRITGGLMPYTVAWNTTVHTSDTILGLGQGYYQATITDASGCSIVTDSIFVHAPERIRVGLIQLIPNSCSGAANGSIEVSASGGLFPYTYEWSNGRSGSLLNMIADGSYRVTATDDRGCIGISDSIRLIPAHQLSASLIELRNAGCYGASNGLIRLRATGGAEPYTYLWSNGQQGATIRDLAAGIYTVSISDALGCSSTATFQVNQPDTISIQLTTLDPVLCPGGYNGKISVDIRGGTPPYSYLWSNGNKQYFTRQLNNVEAGTYHLTVSDQHACVAVLANVELTGPPPFGVSDTMVVHNRCLSSRQGSIDLDIAGGSPPYSYFWSNGSSADTLQGLATGAYTLTITDQRNCKYVTGPYNILSLDEELDIVLDDKADITCFGDKNGRLVVEVTDGTAPFVFHWDTGRQHQTSDRRDSVSGLQTGYYQVTITDQEGCTGIAMDLRISGPDRSLGYTLEETKQISCHEQEDGILAIKASGGTPAYTYTWNGTEAGARVTDLPPGVYNCLIHDKNGCTLTAGPFIITEPPSIEAEIQTDFRFCEDILATAQVSISGGTFPYLVEWTQQTRKIIGPSATSLSCDSLYLSITDFNGCVWSTSYDPLHTSVATVPGRSDIVWTVFPNPASELLYMRCNQSDIRPITYSVTDLLGRIHLAGQPLSAPYEDTYEVYVSDLPPGMYALTLHIEQWRSVSLLFYKY